MTVQKNISLLPFNTFGINEHCYALGTFEDVNTLNDLLDFAQQCHKPIKILGGGSNILITQYCDFILAQNKIKGIAISAETEDHIFLTIGAGEFWHDVVMYCVNRNYQGIENMALIPGTCGAAPMQNIGAYGIELKDFFVHLEALHLQNRTITSFNHAACKFGYRESVFKHEAKDQYVILNITLRLNKTHHYQLNYGDIQNILTEKNLSPSPKNIAEAVIAIRQSKLPDPKEIGNAGSFFKNPTINIEAFEALRVHYPAMPNYSVPDNKVKIPAGWLIEQCGWKGFIENNYGVHKKQALVLVNYGNALGRDILELSKRIIDSVQQKFNITLEREVNIW